MLSPVGYVYESWLIVDPVLNQPPATLLYSKPNLRLEKFIGNLEFFETKNFEAFGKFRDL